MRSPIRVHPEPARVNPVATQPRPRPGASAVNPLPFAPIPTDLLLDRRLIPTDIRLAGLLLTYARQSDACWPAVATLAGDLGVCERTVQYSLARLKRAGWVAERPAGNPTGRELVLCWREGCNRRQGEGCNGYSQGLPRPRVQRPSGDPRPPEKQTAAAPAQRPEKTPEVAPEPPTEAESALFAALLGSLPAGHPMHRIARANAGAGGGRFQNVANG